jgi:hypothetical protein
LRFATAGVVLLLVLAFAADQTNVVERKGDTGTYLAAGTISEEDEAYWTVAGVKNDVDADSQTPAELVVPDGSDNVVAAVSSLSTSGIVLGFMEVGAGDVPRLVLTEGEEETGSRGNTEEFAVVSDSSDTQGKFAANGASVPSELDAFMKGQEGSYLNMVPVGSDNNMLYSFNLNEAQRAVRPADDNDWLRPLEYGLIGLVGVLGGVTAALWLRQRRARVAEASRN